MSEARSQKLLKIFLPILVLLAGAGATAALIASRKAPVAQERPVLGPLVDVDHLGDHSGEARAAEEERRRGAEERAGQLHDPSPRHGKSLSVE